MNSKHTSPVVNDQYSDCITCVWLAAAGPPGPPPPPLQVGAGPPAPPAGLPPSGATALPSAAAAVAVDAPVGEWRHHRRTCASGDGDSADEGAVCLECVSVITIGMVLVRDGRNKKGYKGIIQKFDFM